MLNLKQSVLLFIGGAIFSFSHSSYAVECDQTNNEINGLVGMANGSGTLFVEVTSSSNQCSCTVFRFKNANTDTDKALSILLAAKLSSRKVRVDLLDSTDCDSAYKVYLH